jgi:hypothetical protein
MDDDWVIATVPHADYECPGWLFPHVHCLIVMGTPSGIRTVLRDYQDAMARSW